MKSLPLSKPLIVLEMANNHMGDTKHAFKLINAFADVCKEFPFQFAFKLQYRQMNSFIHPDYQSRMDLKYVKRFMETRLTREQFEAIIAHIRKAGFLTMCTPFDSESVPLIVEQQFDIIKVASCSFTDWPLLESIVETDLPIIASAAAATAEELDNVVTFFTNRNKEFALNHCVAEYPTPPSKIQLNQIDYLRSRYPEVPIGYSTHEPPEFTGSIAMAVAKGATMFERHVALASDKYQPNDYSATPEQLRGWLKAIEQAFALCGAPSDSRIEAPNEERESLRALRRGAYLKKNTSAGQSLTVEDVYFAIPCQEGQISANDWSKYIHRTTIADLNSNSPLLESNCEQFNARSKVLDMVSRIKEVIHDSNIIIPPTAALELSHHYGADQFGNIGAAMITIMNRQYCKKLIIQLPGQSHPDHLHKRKDESFYVVHGEVEVSLEGKKYKLSAGEMINIPANSLHSFRTDTGTIFEEISTRHFNDDSYYRDDEITHNTQRKTFLKFWQNI